MKLTPQIKVGLFIAGLALALAGLAAATLYPQYAKAQKLKAEKEQLQVKLLQERTLLARRTQLEKESPELRKKAAEQKAQVPQDAQLSAVLRQIQTLAYNNHHWMTNIKNTVPVSTKGVKYNSWDCEITLEGNWLDTLTFLRQLRDMDRKVRVNNIDFTRAIDLRNNDSVPNRVVKHWDPEQYPVRTVITATLYYIPQENVTTTSNSSAQPSTAPTTSSTTAAQGGAQ